MVGSLVGLGDGFNDGDGLGIEVVGKAVGLGEGKVVGTIGINVGLFEGIELGNGDGI